MYKIYMQISEFTARAVCVLHQQKQLLVYSNLGRAGSGYFVIRKFSFFIFCSCSHTLFKLPIEDSVHCLKFIFTFIADLLLCLNFEEIVCTGLYD